MKKYTFTFKTFSDKQRKNLAILDYVRRKGSISRTDISKETGINIVSVSNYVFNYIRNHLVSECGLDTSSGGRRPELVTLNLKSAYVAGIDIGPEKLTGVIADLGLNKKTEHTLPRPRAHMDEVFKDVIRLLEELYAKFKTSDPGKVELIGIGASGVVDINAGTVHDTDPARGKTKTNFFTLVRMVEERFKVPALIVNDATAAAFGELSLSPRDKISEMLYIYSDIGCGIIINGDIYCGASGSAGEIQLILNNKEKDPKEILSVSSYGIRGVDLGIVSRIKELTGEGQKSRVLELAGGNKDKITKEMVFKAASENDEVSKEILIEAARWLAIKVAYLLNVFNPQLIVLGGGMEKAGNIFMDALINSVKILAYEEAFNATQIVPSFLGDDAVALGAAALSVRELFINS